MNTTKHGTERAHAGAALSHALKSFYMHAKETNLSAVAVDKSLHVAANDAISFVYQKTSPNGSLVSHAEVSSMIADRYGINPETCTEQELWVSVIASEVARNIAACWGDESTYAQFIDIDADTLSGLLSHEDLENMTISDELRELQEKPSSV